MYTIKVLCPSCKKNFISFEVKVDGGSTENVATYVNDEGAKAQEIKCSSCGKNIIFRGCSILLLIN
jgi:phage FluMu protein Com